MATLFIYIVIGRNLEDRLQSPYAMNTWAEDGAVCTVCCKRPTVAWSITTSQRKPSGRTTTLTECALARATSEIKRASRSAVSVRVTKTEPRYVRRRKRQDISASDKRDERKNGTPRPPRSEAGRNPPLPFLSLEDAYSCTSDFFSPFPPTARRERPRRLPVLIQTSRRCQRKTRTTCQTRRKRQRPCPAGFLRDPCRPLHEATYSTAALPPRHHHRPLPSLVAAVAAAAESFNREGAEEAVQNLSRQRACLRKEIRRTNQLG